MPKRQTLAPVAVLASTPTHIPVLTSTLPPIPDLTSTPAPIQVLTSKLKKQTSTSDLTPPPIVISTPNPISDLTPTPVPIPDSISSKKQTLAPIEAPTVASIPISKLKKQPKKFPVSPSLLKVDPKGKKIKKPRKRVNNKKSALEMFLIEHKGCPIDNIQKFISYVKKQFDEEVLARSRENTIYFCDKCYNFVNRSTAY